MSGELLSFNALALQLGLFISDSFSFSLGSNSCPFSFGLLCCFPFLFLFGGLQSSFSFFLLFAKALGLGSSNRCFSFLLYSGLLGSLEFEFLTIFFGLVSSQFLLFSFLRIRRLPDLLFLLFGLLARPVFFIFFISLLSIDLELDAALGHITH